MRVEPEPSPALKRLDIECPCHWIFLFRLNISYQPPVELIDFLDAGDPPVCVSFGSMVHRDAEKIDHIVRSALKQTGQRGVILSGWGSVKQSSSKDLFYLDVFHMIGYYRVVR